MMNLSSIPIDRTHEGIWKVLYYTANDKTVWDAFVKNSKQGTFLLYRDYLEYHRDRFADSSLLIYHRGRLFALFPANRVGEVVCSHQGLTYGGLITSEEARTLSVCEAFGAINAFLKQEGVRQVVYKAIPHIYHRQPAEEDLYALIHVCKAYIVARDVSTTLSCNRLSMSESRKAGVRKASRCGLIYKESNDWDAFWTILSQNLQRQYGAVPVHTLQEIVALKNRFPQAIKLYMSYDVDVPLAGTVVYETGKVIHTQYISASIEGKKVGALDGLFEYLLHQVYKTVDYFDFGTSCADGGRQLNESLIFQKEGFGGRAICYDRYEYTL